MRKRTKGARERLEDEVAKILKESFDALQSGAQDTHVNRNAAIGREAHNVPEKIIEKIRACWPSPGG